MQDVASVSPNASSLTRNEVKNTDTDPCEPVVVVPLVDVKFSPRQPIDEHIEMCLVCGSSGNVKQMIFCHDCGECYHTFCLTPPIQLHKLYSVDDWRCPHCKFCEKCFSTQQEEKLIVCDQCDRCFHIFCLEPPLKEVPEEGWRCSQCVRCLHCGVLTPGASLSDRWTHSYTLCASCGEFYDQKLAAIKDELLSDAKHSKRIHTETSPLCSKSNSSECPHLQPSENASLIQSHNIINSQISFGKNSQDADNFLYGSDFDSDVDFEEEADEEEVQSAFKEDSEDDFVNKLNTTTNETKRQITTSHWLQKGMLTFKNAALLVLKEAGQPLSVNQITEICLKKGYITTEGKTPARTMGCNLYGDVNKKGDKSPFVRLGNGYFTLAEWAKNLTPKISKVKVRKKKTKAKIKTKTGRRLSKPNSTGSKPMRVSADLGDNQNEKTAIVTGAVNVENSDTNTKQQILTLTTSTLSEHSSDSNNLCDRTSQVQSHSQLQTNASHEKLQNHDGSPILSSVSSNNNPIHSITSTTVTFSEQSPSNIQTDHFQKNALFDTSSIMDIEPLMKHSDVDFDFFENSAVTSPTIANAKSKASSKQNITSPLEFADSTGHISIVSAVPSRDSDVVNEILTSDRNDYALRDDHFSSFFPNGGMKNFTDHSENFISRPLPATEFSSTLSFSGSSSNSSLASSTIFSLMSSKSVHSMSISEQSSLFVSSTAPPLSTDNALTVDLSSSSKNISKLRMNSEQLNSQQTQSQHQLQPSQMKTNQLNITINNEREISLMEMSREGSSELPTAINFQDKASLSNNVLKVDDFHEEMKMPALSTVEANNSPKSLSSVDHNADSPPEPRYSTSTLSPPKRGRGRPRKYPDKITAEQAKKEREQQRKLQRQLEREVLSSALITAPTPSTLSTAFENAGITTSSGMVLRGVRSKKFTSLNDDYLDFTDELSDDDDYQPVTTFNTLQKSRRHTLRRAVVRRRSRKLCSSNTITTFCENRPEPAITIDEQTPITLDTIKYLEKGPALKKVFTYVLRNSGNNNIKETNASLATSLISMKLDQNEEDILISRENFDYYERQETILSRSNILFTDIRRCVLCCSAGDYMIRGRLLPLDTDKWIHCNCALWSSEVYESEDGELINVSKAIKRGLSLKCCVCHQFGASVSCHNKQCTMNFHFPCAIRANCKFHILPEDKYILCQAHALEGNEKHLVRSQRPRQRQKFSQSTIATTIIQHQKKEIDNLTTSNNRTQNIFSDTIQNNVILPNHYSEDYNQSEEVISGPSTPNQRVDSFVQALSEPTQIHSASGTNDVKTREDISENKGGIAMICESDFGVKFSTNEETDKDTKSSLTTPESDEIFRTPLSLLQQNKKLLAEVKKEKSTSKKKQRQMGTPMFDISLRSLQLRVGALTVQHFGTIRHDCSQWHTENVIYPLGFTCKRLYWSIKPENQSNCSSSSKFSSEFKHISTDNNNSHCEKSQKQTQFRRCLYKIEVCDNLSEVGKDKVSEVKTSNGPLFKVTCEDDPNFVVCSFSPSEVWKKVVEEINRNRADPSHSIRNHLPEDYYLGFGCPTVKKYIEQLPNARKCKFYRSQNDLIIRIPRAVVTEVLVPRELRPPLPKNLSGCVRTEGFARNLQKDTRLLYTFSFHPSVSGIQKQEQPKEQVNNTAVKELPVGMVYRQMKTKLKNRLQIQRSPIHEWGLFAKEDIKENEMIIEYVGELIRQKMADIREKKYTEKGIGCYMFRIDDDLIIDATMKGNLARFINHCCDPNSYTRIVTVEGRRRVIVFAKRDIKRGEEISYDYMFPIEDDKVPCSCGAWNCRGTLN